MISQKDAAGAVKEQWKMQTVNGSGVECHKIQFMKASAALFKKIKFEINMKRSLEWLTKKDSDRDLR